MLNLAAALAVLLLTGCGTVGSTKLDVVVTRSATFELRDDRPIEERRSSLAKESYGDVSRLGDDAITPPGPDLLKTWLQRRLGGHLSGKTVVLREFSVNVVDPRITIDGGNFGNAMSSTPGATPAAGLLALLFIGSIESARSDKTVGVRIGGLVGDVEFQARGGGAFKGRVSAEDINSVIYQALDNAASEIERLVGPTPALPARPALQPSTGSGG